MVTAAVGGAVVVGLLAGCSGAAYSLDSSAIAAGQLAISPDAPTPTPTPLGAWSSAQPCTPDFQAEVETHRPAGTTLTLIDPATISGPLSDPNLAVGDVATCAFTISSGSHRQNQEYFVGMPTAYYTQFAARLVANGFAPGASKTLSDGGTDQLFTKGGDRVLLSFTASPVSLVTIFG
jgi:hypothetical protein